jgi:hypothetical protein
MISTTRSTVRVGRGGGVRVTTDKNCLLMVVISSFVDEEEGSSLSDAIMIMVPM